MATEKFTMADALAIQSEQIRRWNLVLNEPASRAVQAEAVRRNKLGNANTPYDVWRGTDIDSFIHGLQNRYDQGGGK